MFSDARQDWIESNLAVALHMFSSKSINRVEGWQWQYIPVLIVIGNLCCCTHCRQHNFEMRRGNDRSLLQDRLSEAKTFWIPTRDHIWIICSDFPHNTYPATMEFSRVVNSTVYTILNTMYYYYYCYYYKIYKVQKFKQARVRGAGVFCFWNFTLFPTVEEFWKSVKI